MRQNAPGYFRFGRFGPSGQTNGFGQYWEPNVYAAFDFLDDPPTDNEISALRNNKNGLATNTYSDFLVLTTGGICTDSNQYSVSFIRHRLVFNGNSYFHYAVVRRPAYGSTPPVSGEYPILLLLHGNTTQPIELGTITKWDDHLQHTNFYPDQCIVVLPLYFGYEFTVPTIGDYSVVCRNRLGTISETLPGYNLFDGIPDSKLVTPDVSHPQFQTDYLADGYTSDDVQIMAILQSLKAVLSETTALNISLDDNVALLGGSLGAGMLYKVAPVMEANDAPGTLKACIPLYGGTDQYAPFNVRRAKRWLASAVKYKNEDPVYGWIVDTKHTYGDILNNQIRRLESEGVQVYLGDPSISPPPNLKADLRYWFLEDSVAKYWQYSVGPYPLQVHHGAIDDIVALDNSRWLTKMMRTEEVKFDDEHYEYYESPAGWHNAGSLSTASLEAMADLLSDVLGY